MSLTDAEQAALLAQPLTLPCGLVLPNRLVKAAMEEVLGTLEGDPSERDFKLYEEWAKGDWGLVITGNVMVSPTHLGSPVDVRVPFPSSPTYSSSLQAYKRWSSASHGSNPSTAPPSIIQLCHSGRQSLRCSGRPFFQPSKAPSAVCMRAGEGWVGKVIGEIVWGTPEAMTEEEIWEVVEGFVQGARVAKETGWEGVQIHASHGYLIAQWLSPNVNLRTDDWGGSPRKRMRLLLEIVRAIRKEFPLESGFCVGVKLNSSDYVKGGLTEEDALDNVRWLAEAGGVDFIEISGGTYESPKMLQEDHETQAAMSSVTNNGTSTSSSSSKPKPSTMAREAFFLSFANRARSLLSSIPSYSLQSPAPLILLTGGFRTRPSMASALSPSSSSPPTPPATDLIGLGRPACSSPHLPLLLLDPSTPTHLARAPLYRHKVPKWLTWLPLPLWMPGWSTIFHTLLLAQISRGESPRWEMGLGEGLWSVWGVQLWRWAKGGVLGLVLALVVGIVAWWRA
ncbi:hypothetical protein BCR35DRAFT_274072 [Leucosporidium creatinivorum]|uniref:NADH:flavin oxidoreductase/NADH oxidase N-terminal domain-containing protein n=1 Tax=Leucosporidium creatinivorum TaxID=106004 RepID=A0A1Y2G6F6_9BASI|nr:hypothetical protein BCR35DRAFT_274072 [Leucosporidium creatinivorum]